MVRSLLLAALLSATTVLAQKTARTVIPGAYIVEFEDGHDNTDVLNTINSKGKTRMNLDYELFQGVSFQLDDVKNAANTALHIASLPAVKTIWPVSVIPAPDAKINWVANGLPEDETHLQSRSRHAAAPVDTQTTHQMTQIDKLHAQGITGKGIKIAVIDTGVDYLHPALGGCFGPKCVVKGGFDLVGDDYNGFNTPVPDNDPMDCAGHGTHVSGIIAAQPNPFNFTGASPDVSLYAYRVFGCKGSSGNDVLISAYNKAYQGGADIITASIGSANGWSEEPWAVVVSRIVAKGVPCTVAAGNDGDNGLFFASTAADGKNVAAIASYDNIVTPSLLALNNFSVNNGPQQQFGFVSGTPNAWGGVKLPLFALDFDTTKTDDACDPLPASTPDLSKFIVLVRRGTCTFVQKAQNVAAKGAQYLIVYDSGVGTTSIEVSTVPGIKAAGMVNATAGVNFINLLQAKKSVNLSMLDDNSAPKELIVSQNTLTGGGLSTFTTWGPTWEMDVKPQFGAVGGNILSTWPRALGSYAVLSGTSMATPEAAGIHALIAQVRGTLDPILLQNLLAATANPQLFNDGTKFYDFLAPVAQQGSGLIQAFDAAYATTLLTQTSLAFNDTDHFIKSRNFSISNVGPRKVHYTLTHIPTNTFYALGSDGSPFLAPFPNEAATSFASLQFSEKQFSLNRGEALDIDVVPTPPAGVDASRLAVWSGYVAINGSDGTSLSIPYQGLTGSLHKHIVLPSNQTWISNSNDTTNTPVANGTAFVVPAPGNAQTTDNVPALVINLALGSPSLRADLVPLDPANAKHATTSFFGTKSIGQPSGFPSLYNSRGAGPVPWNGQLNDGTFAPPGNYKFVVRALRIFGNAKNEKDWDLSESPVFSIKYV